VNRDRPGTFSAAVSDDTAEIVVSPAAMPVAGAVRPTSSKSNVARRSGDRPRTALVVDETVTVRPFRAAAGDHQ
jgi:hypothetical protein